jgi:hypothetical protein
LGKAVALRPRKTGTAVDGHGDRIFFGFLGLTPSFEVVIKK